MIRYLLLIFTLIGQLFSAPTLRSMHRPIDNTKAASSSYSTSDSQAQEIEAAVNAIMLKVVVVTAICTFLLALLMTVLFLKIKQKISQLLLQIQPIEMKAEVEAGNLKIAEKESEENVVQNLQEHELQIQLQQEKTDAQKTSTVIELESSAQERQHRRRKSHAERARQTSLKIYPAMDVSDGELSPGELVKCHSPFPRTRKKLIWPCKHKFIPPDLEPGELVFISEDDGKQWKNWYRDVKPNISEVKKSISSSRSNSASAGFGATKSLSDSDSVTLKSKSSDSSLASVSTLPSETRSEVESLIKSVSSSVTASSLCSVTPLGSPTESDSLKSPRKSNRLKGTQRDDGKEKLSNCDGSKEKETVFSKPTSGQSRTVEKSGQNYTLTETKKSRRRPPQDKLSNSNLVSSNATSRSHSIHLATTDSLHELAIPKFSSKPQPVPENKTSPAREKRLQEKHEAHMKEQRTSVGSKTSETGKNTAVLPDEIVKVRRRGSSLCIQVDKGDIKQITDMGSSVRKQSNKPNTQQGMEDFSSDNLNIRRPEAVSTLTTARREETTTNTALPASVRMKRIMFRPGAMRKRRSIFGGQSKSADYWTIIARKSLQNQQGDQSISNSTVVTSSSVAQKVEPGYPNNAERSTKLDVSSKHGSLVLENGVVKKSNKAGTQTS